MEKNETYKPDLLLVLCNAPDSETAKTIARQVVAARLAACANILPHCCSIYRWQGAVEEETETPILLKTTAANLPKLTETIIALHPHDVPEIIAVPLSGGSAPYLRWLAAECE